MKKIVLSLVTAALFVGISQTAVAQKKIKEGKITYTVSFPELPEEAKSMAAMMPNKMEVYFNKSYSRSEMSGGMVQNITLVDLKTKKSTTYMNMMGQKIATEVEPGEDEEKNKKIDIQYAEDTKEIMGYKCKKAIISADGNNVEVYYTKDIEISAMTSTQNNLDKIDGFPMEYSVQTNGVKMLMTVTDISKEAPEASMFEAPEGYKKMTQEEVQKAFGGGR